LASTTSSFNTDLSCYAPVSVLFTTFHANLWIVASAALLDAITLRCIPGTHPRVGDGEGKR